MPDLSISIGGRIFQVSCQPGEEHFLRSAAAMLDAEARPLIGQLGRLPETRLLLMAGLMLADKTAASEDEVRALRARIAELEARVVAPPDTAVVPQQIVATMVDIATRAEAMAARIEKVIKA